MGDRSRGRFLHRVELIDSSLPDGYPFDIPAVAELDSLEFGDVTVLIGDNGSGKSTVVEAVAELCGFNPEGGNRNLRFETFATHSGLAGGLRPMFHRQHQWGWFLRAETFYGMATHIATDDPRYGVRHLFPDLHGRSHGESFLQLMEVRFGQPGLYIMDEPESALSFHGQLRLLVLLHDAVARGSQFIIATHSPLLMHFPGAALYELGGHGVRRVDPDDVAVVALWRRFLDAPEVFFDALLADDESE